jgi:hypothetical protein
VKRVALLGAEGTGKSRLADELAAHLRQRGLPGVDIVIADAGTLAADADLLRSCEAVLLMGLDLPHAHDREAADALLRSLLEHAAVAYQVVYGTGPARLRSALVALVSAGVLPPGGADRETDRNPQRAWTWVCEKCSDPACEHRLFQALREERGDAA